MKKSSSLLTGFLAMLFAAGLLSSAGTAQAATVYSANFGSGTISSWDTSNPGAGATTILSGIVGPLGVATDSLGNIYVSSWDNGSFVFGFGSIQKYTQGGNFVSLLAGGFTFGLGIDSSDNLYYNYVDGGGATGKTTTSLTSLGNVTWAPGNSPTGMFIDASGNVTVVNVNGDDSYVSTYNSSGGLIDTFSNPTAFNPMNGSYGVTRDAAGNYYVSSRVTGNISKWDSNGDLVNGSYISTGADAYGLLVDGSTLFVASHGTGAILYYDLANSGSYLGEISVGASPTYMNFATVPEPSTAALVCAAALLAGGTHLLRRRQGGKVS
jgi:hypothetical protein